MAWKAPAAGSFSAPTPGMIVEISRPFEQRMDKLERLLEGRHPGPLYRATAGLVAVYACRHEDRVARLVLLAPPST